MSRLTGDDAPRALNTLAREQMKLRLLADVRTDMTVCEIEGWGDQYKVTNGDVTVWLPGDHYLPVRAA